MIKEVRNVITNELEGYLYNDFFVPIDENNMLYQEIQTLLEQGLETLEPAFTEEERIQEFKEILKGKILELADLKTIEAKQYLAQMNLTDEQWERYKAKYNKALDCVKNGNCSYFELEASDIDGIDAKQLAEIIVQKYNEAQENFDNFIKLIEFYRRKANKIIDSLSSIEQLYLAMNYFEKAESFGPNTTEDDIKNLFSSFENELNN